MQEEYHNLFFGGGDKSSTEGHAEKGKQKKVARTTIEAKGGSHEIATILSDMYSPTFKPDFKKWLETVPDYPKAFLFKMGSIVDLFNFRAHDLFPEEDINWGCEGQKLLQENSRDGFIRWYYLEANGTKRYCPFWNRDALDDAIRQRRASLQTAIDIYFLEVIALKRRTMFFF